MTRRPPRSTLFPYTTLLEALPVEQRDRELDALLGRQLARDLEVGLVDLREPGVDDLLVELLLFLEAKDLGRLLVEDADDPVEHRVVEVGVVDRDRLQRAAEGAGEGQAELEPVEG